MKHVRKALIDAGHEVMEHQSLPFYMKFETVAGEDWTGQKLDVTVWKDEVSFLLWVLTAFDSVTWFLVAILVVIIAIGIMNTMWNSVRERTREIGTMRAIGMQRSRVLRLILLEAALLGFVASSLGAIVGAGLSIGLNALEVPVPVEAFEVILLADSFRFSVHLSVLVAAVLSLSFFTTLAAAWPALRAARLRPITAIQHVE
jgi:putative ABC transport system permease protein